MTAREPSERDKRTPDADQPVPAKSMRYPRLETGVFANSWCPGRWTIHPSRFLRIKCHSNNFHLRPVVGIKSPATAIITRSAATCRSTV
jgi:hypothetical protein